MKLVSLEDLFQAFLEEPTCAGFLRVREQLVSDRDYAPHPLALVELADLVAERQCEAALEDVAEMMPTWGLCPRVHFLAAQAAEFLGELEEVELRRFLVSSCLEGILSTGRGTRRQPYLATYPSDVQDVLAAKGLTAKSQRLIEAGDLRLDGIVTHAGPTVWFNVGDMLSVSAAMQQSPTRARRVAARG